MCGQTIVFQRTTTTTTGSSSSGGHSHPATPKCNNDCLTAKRNARLADALGISQEGGSKDNKNVMYSDELVGFARGNLKFLGLVEKTFAE
jgi:transcriptional repressor NF-X1